MGRNLLLNSIKRDLTIFIYRKKGIFYKPKFCTVFNSILSSTVTSINFQLVNISNVSGNLYSCITNDSSFNSLVFFGMTGKTCLCFSYYDTKMLRYIIRYGKIIFFRYHIKSMIIEGLF